MTTLRTISLLLLLLAFAGCASTECTSEDVPKAPNEDLSASIEDWEMYWYHRGADATRAVWSKFRLSGDVALLSDGKGGEPSYAFSTYAYYLLLDNVATFWRKDLAAEAVSAYYYDFSAMCPDRAANCRNDEVLRWAIACERASRITRNKTYLEEAKTLYDSLWLNQVDNAMGGGMWHRSDEKTVKSASANLSAVIAAIDLYHATQDLKYLLQGRKLYKWTAERLFSVKSGAVFEDVAVDDSRSNTEFVGNIGLFIGASMRLYRSTGSAIYLQNAKKAADHFMKVSKTLEATQPTEDSVGWLSRGFAMHYLSELARRPGCEKYRDYILANARTAWTSRRLSDGLNGSDWTKSPSSEEAVDPKHAISAAFLYFSASRACR